MGKSTLKALGVCLSTAVLLLIHSCTQPKQSVSDKAATDPATSPSAKPSAAPSSTPSGLPSPVPSNDAKIPSAAVLQHIYENVELLGVCDGDLDRDMSQEVSAVYPVSDRQYLVELLCFMGAYQGSYEYLLYRSTPTSAEVSPLKLDRFEPNDAGKLAKINTRAVSGLPSYNPEQKTLTMVTQYRGLADCGSMAQYQWQGDNFELLEYRSKAECDGNYLKPEQYPKIYP